MQAHKPTDPGGDQVRTDQLPIPPTGRAPRRHLHRAVTAAAVLSLTTLSALTGLGAPAGADSPSRTQETVVHLSCVVSGEFGTAQLGLEHISTGLGNPGGDLTVWGPGADPEQDLPVLGGYHPAITREGMVLTGEIPLEASGPGDDPGQGVAGTPLAGQGDPARYEVTFAAAGPSRTEVVRGPLYEYDVRYNQRFRNEKVRTPLTATGILTLPGHAPAVLTGCTGEEVVQHIVVTSPATSVGRGDHPFGFADGAVCQATSTGSTTALFGLTGGEGAVAIFPEGAEDAAAFGAVYPDMTRTRLTAVIPMYGPDGADLGEADLQASLRAVDRGVQRHGDGGSFRLEHLEHVVADGTIHYEGVTFTFSGCDGLRVRQTTVTR